MTATGIVTASYRDAQKLPRGAVLSSDQLADGIDRLNDLINFFGTQGLKLFLASELVVTLVSGQQAYTFMPGGNVNIPKPLRIDFVAYWDSANNARPLIPIAREEWTRLSSRTDLGSVNQYFVDKQYDRVILNLWNTPDDTAATGTLRATVRTQPTNPIVGTDTAHFPPEWALALRWGLADELTSGMPESTQKRCAERAQLYRMQLEDWDYEDAETYFQPDTRSMNLGVSRFR